MDREIRRAMKEKVCRVSRAHADFDSWRISLENCKPRSKLIASNYGKRKRKSEEAYS